MKRNGFPLVDIIGNFVIETSLYSKDYTPQAGSSEKPGIIASSDIYCLAEWKRAERQRKRNSCKSYEINGSELEIYYKTKKEVILGHKKYVELGKKGELDIL